MRHLTTNIRSVFALIAMTLFLSLNLNAEVPDAPENLQVMSNYGGEDDGIFLLWKHDGDDDNFSIYRAEGRTEELSDFSLLSESKYELFGEMEEDVYAAFVKHEVNKTYSYYVTALNDDGESDGSNIVDIKVYERDTRVIFTSRFPLNESLVIGEEWTFDFEAKSNFEDAEIIYSFSEAPEEATIDEATGEASWTPTEGGIYSFNVKAEVKGEEDLFAQMYFSLTVITCEEPAEISLDIKDDDGEKVKDGTIIVYGKTNDNEIAFIKNMRFSDSPVKVELDKGSYTFEIHGHAKGSKVFFEPEFYDDAETIEDATWIDVECGTELTLNIELEKEEFEIHEIEIVSEPVRSAKVGVEYTYQVEYETDADEDDIILELEQAPEGAEMDENGLITWTPQENGTFKFGIFAMIKNQYGFDLQEFAVNVLECEVAATIKGTVTNEDGENVEYGEAMLIDADNIDELFNGNIFTENIVEIKDGEYVFDNVDKGNYILYFYGYGYEREDRGYFPEFYNDTRDIEDAEIIEIDCGDEFTANAVLEEMPSYDTYVKITSEPIKKASIDQEYSYQVEYETNYDGEIEIELKKAPEGAEIDENGLITWTPTENGRYRFHIMVGLGEYTYFNDFQEFNVVVSECDELATLKGTVTDEEGNPIIQGMVLVTDGIMDEEPNKNTFMEYVFFEEGEYEISGLDKGTYYVFVDARTEMKQYYPEWHENKNNWMEADAIELDCGDVVTVDFELEEIPQPNIYSVSGRVTDEDTGEPLRWISVTFLGENDKQAERIGLTAWTDENGEYYIDLPDTYTYVAYAASMYDRINGNPDNALNYWPEYYDNVTDVTEATVLELTEDLANIDFTLERIPDFENGLSGNIEGEGGEEITPSFAAAFLVDPANDEYDDKLYYSRAVETNEEGEFTFENLIPGEYVVMGIPFNRHYVPGYYKEGEIAVKSWENATRVTVEEEGVTDGNVLILDQHKKVAGKGRIRGYVGKNKGKTSKITDEVASKDALVGAMVFAADESGNIVKSIETNENGSFDFTGLANGTYTISADKVGYFNMERTITIDDENQEVNTEMTLDNKTTSVNENTDNISTLNVYPNPAVQKFNLEYNSQINGLVNITISDLNGNQVFEATRNAQNGYNSFELEMQNVSTGTYFIKVKNNNGAVDITPIVITK